MTTSPYAWKCVSCDVRWIGDDECWCCGEKGQQTYVHYVNGEARWYPAKLEEEAA